MSRSTHRHDMSKIQSIFESTIASWSLWNETVSALCSRDARFRRFDSTFVDVRGSTIWVGHRNWPDSLRLAPLPLHNRTRATSVLRRSWSRRA